MCAYGAGNCADTVVYGTIRTAETEKPVAEALAIKDGKFVYVGDEAGAAAFVKDGVTRVAGMTWHIGTEEAMNAFSSYFDEYYVKHPYPIKSFFDAGIKVTSHTDFPANEICPQNPFGIMEIAVSGRMPHPVTGELTKPFYTEELVTREQAFQALTINGAWQVGLENERGSIKVGKWADFVLADKDVFTCPETDIRKTKVVSTWFEGSEVYSRNAN